MDQKHVRRGTKQRDRDEIFPGVERHVRFQCREDGHLRASADQQGVPVVWCGLDELGGNDAGAAGLVHHDEGLSGNALELL
jgi:hypothetical protein